MCQPGIVSAKLLQCNANFAAQYKLVHVMDMKVALISRPDDVRKRNRRHLIATLRQAGMLSRKDMSELTGLSPATVTAITSDLLAESVLEVLNGKAPASAMPGRPRIALRLNPQAARVAAVVLRLNSVSVTILDYTGVIIGRSEAIFDTLAASADRIRDTTLESVKAAIANAGTALCDLRAISVGVQGVTDVDGQVVLWSPITRHRNLSIADWLGRAFDCPVSVSNDCDLLVRALNWRDPVRYGTNFAAILMSQGVGMGLYRQGRIVNGTVSSGCEFGHMMHVPKGAHCRCGSLGCIEAYSAAYALERRALGRDARTPPPAMGHKPDVARIALAAAGGDADAIAAFAEAGEAIGYGLGTLFALVDPVPIVMVGEGTLAPALVEPSIRSALAQTMAGQAAEGTVIDWVSDEEQLMQEGCALNALLHLDSEFAQTPGEALSQA